MKPQFVYANRVCEWGPVLSAILVPILFLIFVVLIGTDQVRKRRLAADACYPFVVDSIVTRKGVIIAVCADGERRWLKD